MTLFKNKKVVVMGLGLLGGGAGVAKFFAKQGAEVLVTDLKTEKDLKKSVKELKGLPIKYVLGRHQENDFKNADLIIKNPAVPRESPYLKIARKNNIPIETDISIFFKLCKAPIIGVTGTKGKSTVATLIYLFLKIKYSNTFLAGNIGVTPLAILSKIKKNSKVVLELSNFELEDLKQSPQMAIITNLFPDHLNRYKNFQDYINSKKPIFKYQKKNDILILNQGNPEAKKLAKEAPSKVLFFTPLEITKTQKKHKAKESLTGFKDSNISAAVLAAKIFGICLKDIKKVLADFKGVPHRQELIAVKKGVKYINDTTATNPGAAKMAIRFFSQKFPDSKIILIAGGVDKNLDYKEFAEEIKKKVGALILLPGTASDKIKKELGSFKEPSSFWAKSMEEAVKKASELARKNDIVLLSPAAASFNLFKNEFDRAEQFIKFAGKL